MHSLAGIGLLVSALLPSSYAAATCPYTFKNPAPAGSSCGTQGSVTASALQSTVVTTFSACRNACLDSASCSSFSFAFTPSKGTEQCKLYSSAVSALGFTNGDTNTFFYDTNCFNQCAFMTVTTTRTTHVVVTHRVTLKAIPTSSGFLPVSSTAPRTTKAAGGGKAQNVAHVADSESQGLFGPAAAKRMLQKREQTITRTVTSVVSLVTTKTTTIYPAGATLAACGPNNFLGPNLPGGKFLNNAPAVYNPDGSMALVNSFNATSQYDCCASCIKGTNCALFAYQAQNALQNGTNCLNVIVNGCPNQQYANDTFSGNNDPSLIAVSIGNGNCGFWMNAPPSSS